MVTTRTRRLIDDPRPKLGHIPSVHRAEGGCGVYLSGGYFPIAGPPKTGGAGGSQ